MVLPQRARLLAMWDSPASQRLRAGRSMIVGSRTRRSRRPVGMERFLGTLDEVRQD